MLPFPRCTVILFCFRPDEYSLLSTYSIVMSVGSRYVDDLMISTTELYLILEFSAKHPSFVKVMNSFSGVFKNFDTLLALSVSDGALDSDKNQNWNWLKKKL